MKYTEQLLKDEHEQAVKRHGELYAKGYIEGLRDGEEALNTTFHNKLSELLSAFLDWQQNKYRMPYDTNIEEQINAFENFITIESSPNKT